MGDFSSCESEAFISGTSESSDTEGVQPLEKLKTMLRTNGECYILLRWGHGWEGLHSWY